jgi:TolB-like protein/DNA-binding winged helix-turn-helix (wHTH) protein
MNERVSEQELVANRLPLRSFVLDLAAGELVTAEGRLAGLRRQALEVLLVLGARSGQVVSRDELMRSVWPDVVVGDGSLTQAISDIRRVLGDETHELVRNVARRGYMLVPDRTGAAAAAVPPEPSVPAPAVSAEAEAPARRPPWAALLGVMVLWVAVGTGAWLVASSQTPGWLTPAEAARPPLPAHAQSLSIAVLPLTVEGDRSDVDWLAGALHGDLITELGRSPDFWVIARDTMARFAGPATDPREVARELGVRHVAQGSLRREGEQIRLNLALVDGVTGVQRWADTFAAPRAALPQVIGDMAIQIESVLRPALFRANVARKAMLSPDQVGADELAMRGVVLWHRGLNRDNIVEGLGLLERAVALDPGSIRAWGALATMNLHGMLNGWLPDPAAAQRRIAEATAQLDQIDREGQATYNAKTIAAYLKDDVEAMLQTTSAWTERYRTAWALGAHGFALFSNGRFDESVQALETALKLSPRDSLRADYQYRLALAHFGAERWELAHEWGRAAAFTNPQLRWPPVHVAALWQMGRTAAAREAMAEYTARHGAFAPEQLRRRLRGEHPRFVPVRERLERALADAGAQAGPASR